MRKATYTINWTIDDDGTTTLKRVNDGFNVFELMGILEIIQKEIIQQCTGKIQPDFIERKIVVDPKPKPKEPKYKLTFAAKKGWINRHYEPLPKYTEGEKNLVIKILHHEGEFLCEYFPHDGVRKVAEGYLGTARVIASQFKGIGFNVWEQNDSEFIYYQLITTN